MKTAAFILAAFLSSCAFEVSKDGAKSFRIDGEQAARAIQILSEK